MNVAVVGGGYAGMYAAGMLAAYGQSSVDVYDAKTRPGWPPNSTNGIAWHWIREFMPDMPQSCISARINSVRLVGPGGAEGVLRADNPILKDRMGVVLDEPRTIEWLQSVAEKRGAVVHRPVRISSTRDIPGYSALDAVVIADGWSSKVGTEVGLTTELPDDDRHSGFEYVMEPNNEAPDEIVLWFGTRKVPKGYIWSFPQDNGSLRRVGIGIPLSEHRKRSVDTYFQEFLSSEGYKGKIHAREGGVIPTARPVPRYTDGRHWVVGDAGRWCDPLTGGGIFEALATGRAAAQQIVHSRNADDLDWLYSELRLRYRLKRMLYRFSDRTFDKMVRQLDMAFSRESINPIAERKRVLLPIIIKMLPNIIADTVMHHGGIGMAETA
jgi:digeranylgeranylglycerophospholipid reductase